MVNKVMSELSVMIAQSMRRNIDYRANLTVKVHEFENIVKKTVVGRVSQNNEEFRLLVDLEKGIV